MPATGETERPATGSLMEAVLSRPNLQRALKRVRRNGGSPGIDGMTVDELPDWLRHHWRRVREQLLACRYQPQPVRRASIRKPDGGTRDLGIPTALDRLIQQALLQVLQPLFDPSFSEHSHGFRPGRRAHDAIREARAHIEAGKQWVVDVDIEKFFDRVHHDVLMGKLARRIEDRSILRLVRRYLDAGVMANGVVTERSRGTPQGGPLSPLLANVYLDGIDKELEHRGHTFVRYADDVRVFVRSKKAGLRVMGSLTRLFARLHLRVNPTKSSVDQAWERPFLGFGFWPRRDGRTLLRISSKALDRMKARVRRMTRRSRGQSMDAVVSDLRTYLPGWKQYFRLIEVNQFRDLDKWIRRRLRAYQLKQWRRGTTAYRALRKLGASDAVARSLSYHLPSWWRASAQAAHAAFPTSYFDRLGVPRLAT